MKKVLFASMLLSCIASRGFSQASQMMAYQGYVAVDSGAYSGSAYVVLALYDSPDTNTGKVVWSQISGTTTQVIRGYYTVLMDLTTGWAKGVTPFANQYWLDAIVQGVPLRPRVQLTASPYSFHAIKADTASMALLADHADTADYATTIPKPGYADSAGLSKFADSAMNVPSIPIGTILAYGGPELTLAQEKQIGWYICDGSQIAASDYPGYDASCGPIYGRNGGNDYLPDLRGLFLRGVNEGPGAGNRTDSLRDPDNLLRIPPKYGTIGQNYVGTYQKDTLGSHYHLAADVQGINTGSTSGAWSIRTPGDVSDVPGERTSNTGGNETRPKNAYVYWIIKVK